jgi:hypothetical protein
MQKKAGNMAELVGCLPSKLGAHYHHHPPKKRKREKKEKKDWLI